MPDSYGKRRRDQVKGRKATAREERRLARNQRRARRAAGDEPTEFDTPSERPENEDVETGPREDAEPGDTAGNLEPRSEPAS
jgi:hypothetical protein